MPKTGVPNRLNKMNAQNKNLISVTQSALDGMERDNAKAAKAWLQTVTELREENKMLIAAIKAVHAALNQPAHLIGLNPSEPDRVFRVTKSREGDTSFARATCVTAIESTQEVKQAKYERQKAAMREECYVNAMRIKEDSQ